MMTAPNIYDRAIDKIKYHGWVQGVASDSYNRICAEQALNLSTNDFSQFQNAQQAVSEMVGMRLANWNDMPGRTVGEVIELLQRASADHNSKLATRAATMAEFEKTINETVETIKIFSSSNFTTLAALFDVPPTVAEPAKELVGV